MKILMLVPRVVASYRAQFPETTNNAYNYFNYDRRVYNERVFRGDTPSQYKGPEQFTDADYDSLLNAAQGIVNPTLLKYSPRVAYEDALSMAIGSHGNGMFQGKVNANKFEVLVNKMAGTCSTYSKDAKKKKEEAPKPVKPRDVRDLGLNPFKIPRSQTRKTPVLVKTDKGIVVQNKK